MRRADDKKDKELPEEKQIFRCWVEVLELKTGSKRELRLNGVTKIYIPRKKSDLEIPREEILQLKDGPETLEAKNFDDLAAQLRQRYPDEAYERRLYKVRDCEAEERRREAMNQLIAILAEAAVDSFLKNEKSL